MWSFGFAALMFSGVRGHSKGATFSGGLAGRHGDVLPACALRRACCWHTERGQQTVPGPSAPALAGQGTWLHAPRLHSRRLVNEWGERARLPPARQRSQAMALQSPLRLGGQRYGLTPSLTWRRLFHLLFLFSLSSGNRGFPVFCSLLWLLSGCWQQSSHYWEVVGFLSFIYS